MGDSEHQKDMPEDAVLYYAHLSFEDVVENLEFWPKDLKKTLAAVLGTIEKLKGARSGERGDGSARHTNYWRRVPPRFTYNIEYTTKFFETSIKELSEITEEIQREVMPHHVVRLRTLAKTAGQVYRQVIETWKEYPDKDYDNDEFLLVTSLNKEVWDTVASMAQSLGIIVARLENFVGKKRTKEEKVPNQGNLEAKDDSPKVDQETTSKNVFRLEGEIWTISYEGQQIQLKDLRGVRYISILLKRPYPEQHHVVNLYHEYKEDVTREEGTKIYSEMSDTELEDEGLTKLHLGKKKRIRGKSYAKVEKELLQLRADQKTAMECGDKNKAKEIQGKMEDIASQLLEDDRDPEVEKVRKAVCKSIKASIERIKEKGHVRLYNHLTNSIVMGESCYYYPEEPPPWTF